MNEKTLHDNLANGIFTNESSIEKLQNQVLELQVVVHKLKDDIGYLTKAFSHYRLKMSEVNQPLAGGVKYEIQ